MLLRLGAVSAAAVRRPLDGLSGVAAAYGVRKLGSGYAGPCLRLRRSSDNAEQDFGFGESALDAAAVDAWLGGALGFVAKWYDQSGNGRHAVQAAAANQPVIEPANAHQGCVPVTADGRASGGSISKFLALPAGLTLARQNYSAFCVLNPQVSYQNNIQFELGSGVSTMSNLFTERGGVGLRNWNGSTAQLSGLAPRSQPVVEGIVGSPASHSVLLDGATANLGVSPNVTMTGGLLGRTIVAGGFEGRNDYFAFVVLSRALGAGEAAALIGRLRFLFAVSAGQSAQLVLDGDSITEGTGATRLRNNARQLEPLLSKPVQLRNMAVYGQTLATMNANKANIAGLYDDGKAKNICLTAGGSNDLLSATAAAVYATLASYTVTLKAAGFKVIWATITPRHDYSSAARSQWAAYNQTLRDNWAANADGLVDYAADPAIGTQAAAANGLYYPDGIHPSTLTYGIMAGIAAPVVNGLL